MRRAAAATAAMVAVGAALPSLAPQAAAQPSAAYNCTFTIGADSIILPFAVSGSVTPAVSPATVGQADSLSSGSVTLAVAPGSDASQVEAAVPAGAQAQATAVLGPNGSLNFATVTIGAGVSLTLSGGTGAVKASGTPGGVMNIAANQINLTMAGVAVACVPSGPAAILHPLPLAVPPAPAPNNGAAQAVSGNPNHAG